MSITSFSFGQLADGTEVTAYRIENSVGTSVTLIDYGATVQSLKVPDCTGKLTDVVFGYDTAAEYEANDGFLGATIGRVGNRIGGAQFSLNGTTYRLADNNNGNCLHGGVRGFDKYMWKGEAVPAKDGASGAAEAGAFGAAGAAGDSVVFTRVSPDGEENFPGNLAVRVTFTLTPDNALRIRYDADTDRDTLVCLTNHAYFNLEGKGSVLDHMLTVHADRFCENDPYCLPTGKLLPVEGTPFDFRTEKSIGRDIQADDVQLHNGGGYDHCYVLSGLNAAVLTAPGTGIRMRVFTDLPGMQVYSGNFLTTRKGHGGQVFGYRDAVALETQLFPNAMNCYGFPSPVLRAGRHLESETVYAFDCV